MSESNSGNTWLLRYIVTAETAAIIMMVAFFATGYQNLTTHADLLVIAPYAKDKDRILQHMTSSEDVLKQVGESLQQLNLQIIKTNNALELRIQKLEHTNDH